jgi:hypothetical protein
MNAKNVTIRLVWKQYRLQRAFWICMILFAMMLFGLTQIFFSLSPVESVGSLFLIAIAVPAFYALGCGATMFAAEHESGVFDFQRVMPVTSPRFFFANVLFGLMSTLAMIVLLFLVAIIFYTSPAWISRQPLTDMPKLLWPAYFGIGGVGVLELFVWGMFFSLILKRPLIAAILGVAVASIGVQLAITVPIFDASFSPYILAVPGRLAIVALVAIADVLLGCRWLRGEGLLPNLRKRKNTNSQVPALAIRSTISATRPRFWSVFLRLAWQQMRQSVWMWAWFCLALIVAIVIHYNQPDKVVRHQVELEFIVGIAAIGTVVGLPLVGIFVFYHDQQRRMLRFFSERGVMPSHFWWSRQIAGLAVPLLLGIFFYLFFVTPEIYVSVNRSYTDINVAANDFAAHGPLWIWLVSFGILVDVLLIIYCVGQCFAMFFRSGILAMLFSVIFSALLIVWTIQMIFWQVPWWWSIAPWPFLLLLATWLRTPQWLAERNNLRAWLRPAVAIVPMLAILVSMPLYRVYSIPLVDPGFSPEEYLASRKATPEALETAAMYRKAYAAIGLDENVKKEPSPHAESKPEAKSEEQPQSDEKPNGSEPEKKRDFHFWEPFKYEGFHQPSMVKASQKAIELALEASKRPDCDFYADQANRWNSEDASKAWRLLDLMVAAAWQLENDGKLDEAWEHYLGALRIARHLNAHAATTQYHRDAMQLYPKLVGWAARPGQSPERIRAALKQLEQFPVDPNLTLEWLKNEYITDRAILSGDRKVIESQFGRAPDKNYRNQEGYRLSQFELWERFLPWEKYRALRLLDQITAKNLHWLEMELRAAENGNERSYINMGTTREPEFALLEQINLPVVMLDWNQSLRQFDLYRYQRAARNAALISMALEAWKLEHGALPKTLDELTGSYFEKLPTDPFNGRNFRYFPDGLPVALTGQNSNGWGLWISGEEQTYLDPTFLPAKQPFLWSIGPWISDMGPPSDDKATNAPTERYSISQNRYRPPYQGMTARNEMEVWSNGLIFPLP